jgi:hypothetical protein
LQIVQANLKAKTWKRIQFSGQVIIFVYLKMDDIKENISLKELSEIENISVRSLNVCKWNRLINLNAILNHFWTKNSFLDLRNCGKKSNTELTKLCLKYKNYTSKPIQDKPENKIEKQINCLTVRQKKILNNSINSQANSLSVRSFNAIESFSKSNLTVRGLKEILFNPSFNLAEIKNIGKKTAKELSLFFKNIRGQIEIIQLFENDDELTIELFNSYLKRKFSLSPKVLAEIWTNYNSEKGLPLFKAIETLISNNILFNTKEKFIFQNSFDFWNDSESMTLEEIGSKINVTRERSRQIRNQLLSNLNSTFSFIKVFEFDTINLYGIDREANIIFITKELLEEINQTESTNFNLKFVTKILSILFYRSHYLVGNLDNCSISRNYSNATPYKWQKIYLVKREIEMPFDINAIAFDVDRRLNERITETYTFHFETYLMSFPNQLHKIISEKALACAEHVLFSEFELSIDIDERIIFERNTRKQVVEYVYDILERKNEPLDIYQIFNILYSKFPDVTKSPEALRGCCQKDTNLICFGRSSTYGLRKWEDNKTIKGGTIRSIAEEYLNDFDSPKHIFEITEHVNKFRNTNAKSIITNLKLVESSIFVFFNQSFVGLKSKKYQQEYYDLPKFINKSIIGYIRKHNEVSQDKLIEFIESKIRLNRKAIILIIRQLEQDK